MMKQIIVMLFAWTVGVGFSASASTIETFTNDMLGVIASNATGVALATSTPSEPPDNKLEDPPTEDETDDGETRPDKPEGEEGEQGSDDTRPEKPGEGGEGGGEQGGGGSGGASESIALTGVLTVDGVTTNLTGGTLESTATNQNVILAKNSASVTISDYTLNKSGDTSSEDDSNFYAVNAVVAAKTNAMVYISSSTLNSNANGANCLFASGEGSTIYAYDCAITSTKGSSRGLDATYEGTVIAAKMTINTSGDHCAAFATDRGDGSISVTDATMTTAGQGSPLIYSTGAIEVNCVTGTATGAQIAGIEGLSEIRIKNSKLTGSGKKASEPVVNGVIIYQSNSGDYTAGTATFEVSDSTLSSAITNGAMFYATHTEAVITIQNTALDFDTEKNYLLKAAGNDGTNGWGTDGSNGAGVTLTAINQTLEGDISVDGISSNDLYLVNSTYTGTIVNDTTYTGNGGANVFIDADSTWIVTSNCTLKCLTVAANDKIKDVNGATVPIVNSENQTIVSGTSELKVTVANYTFGDFVATNITDFTISRSAFDAIYGSSGGGESEGGDSGSGSGSGSGGAQDHNNWTNYFKPFPPDNAIVKVKIDGASDYGTPDRDHKYCLDGYWDGTAEPGVLVHLLYVTTEGYLFSDGCTSNKWDVTITNNAQEVWPPEDVVAIKTQAKRGATYYLTLKEAIESAKGGGKGGAKITLNDNVTLTETLTVTNSITLDLDGTNVITVGSALTPAFLFTANATISNGTITASNAANVADCVLLRFASGKSTLSEVTLAGDCCLLAVDEGVQVTVTNNCAFTCESAATVCSDGTLTIAGDTSKSDGVVMVAPDGYHWDNGELVGGELSESLAAGTTTNYEDAVSATNAAVAINANKTDCIDVPTGVEGSAKTTYLTKVEAMVTGDNCVVIDLTPEAQSNEQVVIDAVVTNEAVVAALVSTNQTATVSLATTTPGLYYWIQGGTDAGAVSTPGTGVLSTTGGAVELSKPALDATKDRAFFKIAAGVSAPTSAP